MQNDIYIPTGPRFNNIENKKFGSLTTVRPVSASRNGHIRWRCVCDCGTYKDILATHLVSGKIKSCGCLQKRFGPRHKDWTGYGEISGQFWSQIKRGADGSKGRQKIEFNISIEYVWELFLKQKRCCALSGQTLEFPRYGWESGTASLDRIDSSYGYVNGNVQWVHKDINKMKNSFNQEHFQTMCALVVYCNPEYYRRIQSVTSGHDVNIVLQPR